MKSSYFFRCKKRLKITLIELLIVLTLIVTILGLVSFNVSKAVRQQKFNEEVSRVIDLLRLSQDLMLMLKLGVTVKFEINETGTGIKQTLTTEAPLPKTWMNIITKLQKPLSVIHYIQTTQEGDSGKQEIKFLSEEIGMTKGVIRLSTSKSDDVLGALTSYIYLPGYPSIITAQKKYPIEDKTEDAFLKDLSRLIYEEITDQKNQKDCKALLHEPN